MPGTVGKGYDRRRFECELLAELARQLLYAPPPMRCEQVRRAEGLHDQIDPQVHYPFDFIQYRITGYHSEQQEATILPGSAVVSDLRWLIDQLSRSVGMPQDPDEPIETTSQLARRLQVSTKTIDRYRQSGLRCRWVRPADGGRNFIGYTGEAVDHFLKQQARRVRRASAFSHMDASLRVQLIERARALAGQSPCSLHEVARKLARQTGRAVQTIRSLLQQHDQTAKAPIFADRGAPLAARQKRVIARALSRGIAAARIAARFGRARSTIYRLARQQEAARWRRTPIRYIHSADFDREDSDLFIGTLAVECQSWPDAAANRKTDDLPEPLRPWYGWGPLPPDDERVLLRCLNYLRFKASQLRDRLNRYEPRAGDLHQMDRWMKQADRLRWCVVQANLHLVLSVARQHLIGQTDRSSARLIAFLAVGQPVLEEAVDQFDFDQRQTFGAFLTYRLMRRFATMQTDPDRARRRQIDQHLVDQLLDGLARLCPDAPVHAAQRR